MVIYIPAWLSTGLTVSPTSPTDEYRLVSDILITILVPYHVALQGGIATEMGGVVSYTKPNTDGHSY